jgi:4'-phosphopantetheinyl transferase
MICGMTNSFSQWQAPPNPLTLPAQEIHVWRAELHVPAITVEQLAQVLSPEELARANRFRRERDRQDFIVARSQLRMILGRYLAVAPHLLQFGYGDHGKPFLTQPAEALQFNVSHAQGLALYAIGRDRPVGIDLEYVQRPLGDMEQLIQRFFSAQEYAEWRSLPPEQRSSAFFRAWTCKEAYLKAIGTGLAQLDQVEVSLSPDRPAQFTRIHADTYPWILQVWEPAPDYSAALAMAGQDWQLRYWQL